MADGGAHPLDGPVFCTAGTREGEKLSTIFNFNLTVHSLWS